MRGGGGIVEFKVLQNLISGRLLHLYLIIKELRFP
jgi:hypothetical protein